MKNYNNIMSCLAMMQSEHNETTGYNVYCGISIPKRIIFPIEYDGAWYCGQVGIFKGKLDYAHILSNTKHNSKNYPLFINSLLNGVMALHSSHLSSNQPNYPYTITEKQAYLYNAFMDINSTVQFNCLDSTRIAIYATLNADKVYDLHVIESAIQVINHFTGVE